MTSSEIIHLDPSTGKIMHDAALDASGTIGPLLESELSAIQTVNVAADIAQLFPGEVTEAFADFSKEGNPQGALVLRGLMPPKKMHDAAPDEHGNLPTTRQAKATGLLALASAMLTGSPMSYRSNPRGHLPTLITQVTPMQQNPYEGALRTSEAIGWHAEAGGAPDTRGIEFLSLYFVRGQANAPTMVLPGHIVDHAFSDRERLTLRKHQYILGEAILPGSDRLRRPIIRDTTRGPAISYADFYMNTQATRDDGSTARMLKKVRSKIDEIESKATIIEPQTGDVVVPDNNGLHSRDLFAPALPHPRWQMRVFVGQHDTPLFVDPTYTV